MQLVEHTRDWRFRTMMVSACHFKQLIIGGQSEENERNSKRGIVSMRVFRYIENTYFHLLIQVFVVGYAPLLIKLAGEV